MQTILNADFVKTFFFLLPVCLLLQTSLPDFSSTTKAPVNRSFFRIGDQLITLEKFNKQSGNDYVLVDLYNDNAMAQYLAMVMVREEETGLVRLSNSGREVEADLFDKKVVFDPDAIFTSWGRRLHLKANHCWSKAADEYLQQFARFVLDEIPEQKTIVMMTEGTPMSEYISSGGQEKTVKEYHQASVSNAGYFITGDDVIYNKLKKEGQNVVLQNDRRLEDDGSLVVYCAKTNRSFLKLVNVERAARATDMLEVMHKVLK